MTTIYIAYKYNENRETENLFITNKKDEAIALATRDGYDEVVNDETSEVVWTKEKGVVSMNIVNPVTFTPVPEKLVNFINHTKLPGWYLDANNNYCCIIRDKIFTVFVNNDTNDLEFAVDDLQYESNYEWEAIIDFKEGIKRIKECIEAYSK